MSEYYHQFLTSVTGIGENPSQSPLDAHAPGFPPPAMPMAGGPIGAAYQTSLGYFTGFPDPIMFSAPKAQRNRRKSAPGLDHVKHRRTRSGCYMCRSRRVKCDETRPICERCRKGNRECNYPDPPAPKSAGGQSGSSKDAGFTTQSTSPTSSGEDEDDDDPDSKLEPIPDEEEETGIRFQPTSATASTPRRTSTTSSANLKAENRQNSETPSQEGNKSSSPSASTTTSASLSAATHQMADLSIPGSLSSSARSDWAHLPSDMRFYLNYFCENITHFHYCLVQDPEDFFPTILPSLALQNEALLYAVVGFAAYHVTLQNPNGKLQDFLQYYNRSVTILLGSLKRKEKATVATLLTILQLATIEEYLGDWVNLMGHQKAALEIFTKLYTPQTTMQTTIGRIIIWWYARFDVFVAIMGGFPTALPRVWFTACLDSCRAQIAANPDDIRWKLEETSAQLRLISMEMSMLFARGNRGEISPELFAAEHEFLEKRLIDWKDNWDPALTDPSYFVTDFPNARPMTADDIVNPFAPNVVYRQPLFATTMMTAEWHSIIIMHKSQSSTAERSRLFAELAMHAYAICQLFESVENWLDSPKGSLIMIQACIAIGALFLPPDSRHRMWSRRKFALLETKGYIHPITLRSKMAILFEDPSCVRWWLPNDEGFSPILQNIRTFADERNALAVTAQAENLREVRHVFSKLESRFLAEQTMAVGDTGKKMSN